MGGLHAAKALVAALAGLLLPAGAAAQTKLSIMTIQGLHNLPLLAAQQKGIFKRYGLEVELFARGLKNEHRDGLVAGIYQIIHAPFDDAVTLVDRDKADVVAVMGGDHGLDRLIVRPDVAAIADLRGKIVVVDEAGSGHALLFEALLRKNGIARHDYQAGPGGPPFGRREAMRLNQNVKAALLPPPFAQSAVSEGMRDLGPVTTLFGAYQSSVAIALRPWTKANGDTLETYLRAVLEATRWSLNPANAADALRILVDEYRLAPATAATSFRQVVDAPAGITRDARLDMDGVRAVLRLRAEAERTTARPPEAYVDLSFYTRAIADR